MELWLLSHPSGGGAKSAGDSARVIILRPGGPCLEKLEADGTVSGARAAGWDSAVWGHGRARCYSFSSQKASSHIGLKQLACALLCQRCRRQLKT